jgi:hypothetical protein
MSACRAVRQWVTTKVVVPVQKAVTESRQVCSEVRQWIEEKIERPVDEWVSRQERRCRKLPWWNPLRWLCSLVTVVVKVVVWVVETVGKWAVTVICQVVTVVIGFITVLVLRVIGWFVTFMVCLFTDPLEALKSFRDLWSIIVDAVGELIDFIVLLLDDIVAILKDVERLLDSLADSLGWLGVILGFIKGIVGLIRSWVTIVKDVIRALGDIIKGILNLNLCAILGGISDVLTAGGRLILTSGLAVLFFWAPALAAVLLAIRALGAGASGVRDTVDRIRLEKVISDALSNAFGEDTERIERSIDKIGIGSGYMGLPFQADARRLYISSRTQEGDEISLRDLHNSGVIDLYALAGYLSDCAGTFNEPVGEVVYAGTELRVSYADLETYLNDDSTEAVGDVPEFRVYPIIRAHFQTHLELSRRKAPTIGVQLAYDIGELRASRTSDVPLQAGLDDDTAQQSLFERMGRTGTPEDDLAVIPAVSHFHYIRGSDGANGEIFGLTTWWRPSNKEIGKSGVTYRNRKPEWVFSWVLIHEFGHYWGLDHREDRDLSEIMQRQNYDINIKMLTEFLLLGGEPRFTHQDALDAWKWITTDGADSLLP